MQSSSLEYVHLPINYLYNPHVVWKCSWQIMFTHAIYFIMPQTAVLGRSSHKTVQGKVAELRFELTSGGKKDKNNSAKKIALKKIVANMTMSNNDMIALFPDVVDCMRIASLEIKKMYGFGQYVVLGSVLIIEQVFPLSR